MEPEQLPTVHGQAHTLPWPAKPQTLSPALRLGCLLHLTPYHASTGPSLFHHWAFSGGRFPGAAAPLAVLPEHPKLGYGLLPSVHPEPLPTQACPHRGNCPRLVCAPVENPSQGSEDRAVLWACLTP